MMHQLINSDPLRYPILSLQLRQIDRILLPPIMTNRIIVQKSTFEDQVLLENNVKESVKIQFSSKKNQINMLNGQIKRFKFPARSISPQKQIYLGGKHNQLKIDDQKIQELNFDKNTGLDWFTIHDHQEGSQTQELSKYQLGMRHYEEELLIQTNELNKIKARINLQQLGPSLVSKLPKIKVKVQPRYNLPLQPFDAVYKNDNCSILIPSNILSPMLINEKRMNYLKEVNQLRGKYSQSIEPQKNYKNTIPSHSLKRQKHNAKTQKDQLSSIINNKIDPYIMIHVRNNKMTHIQRISTSRAHSLPTIDVDSIQSKPIKIKKLSGTIHMNEQKENSEEQKLLLEQHQINKLLEEKNQQKQDIRLEKIQKWKQRGQNNSFEEFLAQIDETKQPSEMITEVNDVSEDILKAVQLEQQFAEIQKYKQHLAIIRKLHKSTKKLHDLHACRLKSRSLGKVMDSQVEIINNLNGSKFEQKISKQSIHELQKEFINLLQPLRDQQKLDYIK